MTSAEDGVTPEQRGRLDALLKREPLAAVLAALEGAGEEARLIGGAVRNTLMDLPDSDIDIATTALPEETMRRAAAAGFKPVPTGIEHGTVTVVAAGQPFEVTTLREDIETDGRRAVVRFGRDFTHDALRRDFTINALALSPDGRLHDPVGGLADVAARRVRFIGKAGQRIAEDYLRILRFFRFHAAYGHGAPDAAGLAACIDGRAGLDGLSRERVRAELMKLIEAPGAVATVALMSDSGLWQRVTGGLAYPARLARAVARIRDVSAAERLAAASVAVRADAERLRSGLKLSNSELETVRAAAVAFEAMHGLALPDARTARQLAYRLGQRPFALALACELETFEPQDFAALVAASAVPALPFTGREVVAAGVPAGPAVGRVLAAAERQWITADFTMDPLALREILARALAAPDDAA